MQRVEFGFGVGEDKDGKEILSADLEEILYGITNKAGDLFGGGFLKAGRGFWHNGKRLVVERGYVLVIDGSFLVGEIYKMAEYIKDILNQECVHVAQFEVNASNI